MNNEVYMTYYSLKAAHFHVLESLYLSEQIITVQFQMMVMMEIYSAPRDSRQLTTLQVLILIYNTIFPEPVKWLQSPTWLHSMCSFLWAKFHGRNFMKINSKHSINLPLVQWQVITKVIIPNHLGLSFNSDNFYAKTLHTSLSFHPKNKTSLF